MVLNSKFFGVPQNRERVFIIGSLREKPIPEILPLGKDDKKINEIQGQQTNTLTANYDKSQATGSYITESKLNAQETLKINSATKKGFAEAKIGDGIRLEYPESETARGRVIKGNSNTLKSGTEGVVVMDLYNNKEHSDRSPALTEPHHNNLRVRERLQGFPEGWTKGFSESQRYKMMGNAVTVNVVKAIIRRMFK